VSDFDSPWKDALEDYLEAFTAFCFPVIHAQKEKYMPFVTSFERLAMEEGREEGREEGLKHGIRIALRMRFGEQGTQLMREIDAVEDTATLTRILDGIEAAKTVEEVRSYW
jgi:hypothetical protein